MICYIFRIFFWWHYQYFLCNCPIRCYTYLRIKTLKAWYRICPLVTIVLTPCSIRNVLTIIPKTLKTPFSIMSTAFLLFFFWPMKWKFVLVDKVRATRNIEGVRTYNRIKMIYICKVWIIIRNMVKYSVVVLRKSIQNRPFILFFNSMKF